MLPFINKEEKEKAVFRGFLSSGLDKHMSLPHPISLTGGGLPRVIPAFHRRLIRMGGDRGDRLVRFYLSVFSLGKLVVVAKRKSICLFC